MTGQAVPPPPVTDIIQMFHDNFRQDFNTELVRGSGEPVYRPATPSEPARIEFAHGFYSSALHEIAHWCVAGPDRRRQTDYGYWYQPDGRSPAQQEEFEAVEVKPQALEWIFSVAAGLTFFVSCDNLSGCRTDPRPFQEAVRWQALRYLDAGLPARAAKLCRALLQHYHRQADFDLFWQQVRTDYVLPNGP